MVAQQVAQAGDGVVLVLVAAAVDHAHRLVGVRVVQLQVALDRNGGFLYAFTPGQGEAGDREPGAGGKRGLDELAAGKRGHMALLEHRQAPRVPFKTAAGSRFRYRRACGSRKPRSPWGKS